MPATSYPVLCFKKLQLWESRMLFTPHTSHMVELLIMCLHVCLVQGYYYYDPANLRLYLLPVCCFGLNSVCLNQSISFNSSPFSYFLLVWFPPLALTFWADSIILTVCWRSLTDLKLIRVSLKGYLFSVVCSCSTGLQEKKIWSEQTICIHTLWQSH